MTSHSEEVEFEVPGRAVPKGRPRFFQGNAYTPRTTKEYEAKVRAEAEVALPDDWSPEGRFSVTVLFYFDDKRIRDLDNCVKAVTDALNGVVYKDDAQIDVLHAYRFRGAHSAGSQVTVRRLEEVGSD